MAERGSRRPNTLDSIFTLGSMGKMFTAISVAQLVEHGKLSYEDTIGKFLPEYPGRQVRDRVTVGELLTHTSGLGDFLGRRTGEMMRSGVKRAADYLPLFENDPLQFDPGTRWGYSNAGFVLAGVIVERVSGESYFDYVRKHVFAPAGMLSSDPNEGRRVPPLMVTPYAHREGGKWNDREPAGRDIGSPAGGCFSTAPDLLRFAQALREDKLVSHRAFEQLVAPHSSFKTPRGTDYGYGFETWAKRHGRRVVGHGGGTVGVNTEFDLYVEQGYTVIVLSNYDSDVTKIVAAKLRAMILAK
jgi:CubicO group peptidase (beta-lactamase class C family)